MKMLAKVLSKVFDPVVVIPVILMGTVSMAYLNGYRWRFFLLIFLLDAVVPGIYVLIRLIKKQGKDWDIHKREERIPLFMLTIGSHGLGVLTAFLIGRHPLAEMLLGLWLLAVVYAGITFFWKISVHAGVNATLATMVTLFVDARLGWVWLVPLIVGWARVMDNQHDWAQVVVGMVLAPVILVTCYGLWGIL